MWPKPQHHSVSELLCIIRTIRFDSVEGVIGRGYTGFGPLDCPHLFSVAKVGVVGTVSFIFLNPDARTEPGVLDVTDSKLPQIDRRPNKCRWALERKRGRASTTTVRC